MFNNIERRSRPQPAWLTPQFSEFVYAYVQVSLSAPLNETLLANFQ